MCHSLGSTSDGVSSRRSCRAKDVPDYHGTQTVTAAPTSAAHSKYRASLARGTHSRRTRLESYEESTAQWARRPRHHLGWYSYTRPAYPPPRDSPDVHRTAWPRDYLFRHP